ncbi:MAG TPA: GNAT family N-acetyltransferase [Solirubrobacterales bacterium]|nr:GNAT family N-acetyltransferase [Solirubrobacterales bacterium]
MALAETVIRPATESDCELLVELIHELASYEKLADEVVGTPELLRRTLFEERAAEALILETDAGEAVGYAIFYVTFSSFECRSGIWLEDVYVRPEHRRGGIGQAVMEHLAALCVERGHTRFEWCALDWNRPALDFYAGLGAAQLGDWTMLRLERDGIEALSRARSSPPV